jgi:hypothetical protein
MCDAHSSRLPTSAICTCPPGRHETSNASQIHRQGWNDAWQVSVRTWGLSESSLKQATAVPLMFCCASEVVATMMPGGACSGCVVCCSRLPTAVASSQLPRWIVCATTSFPALSSLILDHLPFPAFTAALQVLTNYCAMMLMKNTANANCTWDIRLALCPNNAQHPLTCLADIPSYDCHMSTLPWKT